MACHVLQESDLKNHRVVSMWAEAGIQFRSNLIMEVGGGIDLHEHSYDHVAAILGGTFDVTEITKAGEEKRYQVTDRDRILIPAWHRHSFRCVAKGEAPAEVLCMWGG